MAEPQTGCVVCGGPLEYLTAAEAMTCRGCGGTFRSDTRCLAGHFVCDRCHAADAAEVIERHCRETSSTDPVAIAVELMRHPALKMHGPEHHALVPAALVAAWCNARGEQAGKAEKVAEARRRAEPVLGGFCGRQGACGAAIGVGIFASVVTGATPLATETWGLANRATARALELVGRVGGPRCCKRVTWLALLAAAKFARDELGVDLEARGPVCEWSGRNRECIERRCPFYRT